jgi:hypothetical protein
MTEPQAQLGRRLRLILIVISAFTVLSGLTQVVAPGFVLRILGTAQTDVTTQLFATIGMFMVVVGGALLHALLARKAERILVFWAGVQKILASGAVGIGVGRGVFAPIALGVACVDLVSGVLILWFWRLTAR